MSLLNWIVAILVAATTSWSYAAPTEFSGKYSFQNRITLLTALEVRQVNLDQKGGYDLMEELENAGYVCFPEDHHWYGCKKMHDDWEIPQTVLDFFNKQYANALVVEFYQAKQKPVQQYADANYERWHYYQSIQWNKQKFDGFNMISTKDTEKIIFGSGELVVQKSRDVKSLAYVDSKDVMRDNGIDWVTYYVMMQLDPIQ